MNTKFTATQMSKVGFHAHALADRTVVAYWMYGRGADDGDFLYHCREAEKSFRTIAEILGFCVTPIADTVPASEPQTEEKADLPENGGASATHPLGPAGSQLEPAQ